MRVAKAPDRARGSRDGVILTVALSTAILCVATRAHRASPYLFWNLTRSAPPGLYVARSGQDVKVRDWVVATLPTHVAALAVQRRYIGSDVPVLKRVAAGEGDRVCAMGGRLLINDHFAAYRKSRDGLGRALPLWSGCRRLGRGGYFLLNRDAANSFDSRYFGPIMRADIIARVAPVWTWR
jgi:conjugative transfer signal peptidase TraF